MGRTWVIKQEGALHEPIVIKCQEFGLLALCRKVQIQKREKEREGRKERESPDMEARSNWT